MLIDTHVHESKYSPDSFINLDEITIQAKKIGLDGVCITNHDNTLLLKEMGSCFKKNDTLVLVGAEILTTEGDILVFGVEDIPADKISPEELLSLVNKNCGVAISAHPFRNNNRGLGNNIRKVKNMLHGVEAFNGSTYPHANLAAYALATELKLGIFGASDAHVIEKLGTYATDFKASIRDMKDFIEAVKHGNYCPAIKKASGYERINVYDTLK